MTARGARQHPLGEGDLDFIREHACLMGADEIARLLGATRPQVEAARRQMNRRGERITLRRFVPRTVVCPSCGRARSSLGPGGVCEPCRLQARLDAVRADTADLLALLPRSERAVYERSEASVGSCPEAMPRAPEVGGMDRWHELRAHEEHDLAMEAWTAEWLRRQVKAAQKRRERVRMKAFKAGALGPEEDARKTFLRKCSVLFPQADGRK